MTRRSCLIYAIAISYALENIIRIDDPPVVLVGIYSAMLGAFINLGKISFIGEIKKDRTKKIIKMDILCVLIFLGTMFAISMVLYLQNIVDMRMYIPYFGLNFLLGEITYIILNVKGDCINNIFGGKANLICRYMRIFDTPCEFIGLIITAALYILYMTMIRGFGEPGYEPYLIKCIFRHILEEGTIL